MALYKCVKCGRGGLADDTTGCPGCGSVDPFGEKARVKRNKRIFGAVLFVGAAVAIFFQLPRPFSFSELVWGKPPATERAPAHRR
jgi:hypothetical protein